jgi:hypothetical protein
MSRLLSINILKAIGFSARRKRASRGSVHPVHDRWRARLQQRRKFKCEEYKFVLLMVCLGLSACIRHVVPPLPLSCENACLAKFNTCVNICQNSCPVCQANAIEQAGNNNARYMWLQRAQGHIIAREVNSFRDPLSCTKVTCDCEDDFKICKQQCHGKIKPRLKITPCVDTEIPGGLWLRDILAG